MNTGRMNIALAVLAISLIANIILSKKVIDLESLRLGIEDSKCINELRLNDGSWDPENFFARLEYEFCLYESADNGYYIDRLIGSYRVDRRVFVFDKDGQMHIEER